MCGIEIHPQGAGDKREPVVGLLLRRAQLNYDVHNGEQVPTVTGSINIEEIGSRVRQVSDVFEIQAML